MNESGSKSYKCDQPGCDAVFGFATSLGSHKKNAHGIAGTSQAAQWYRQTHQGKRTPKLKRQGHEGAAMSRGKFPCENCDRSFGTYGGLRIHQSTAHGVPGKSAKYHKGEHAIVKSNGTQLERNGRGHASTKNAHRQEKQQRYVDNIIEAAVAVAFGRCSELCRSVADERDLPSRMFTARVAELLHAASVR